MTNKYRHCTSWMAIIDLEQQPSTYKSKELTSNKEINGWLGYFIQQNIYKFIHNIENLLTKRANKL